MSITQNTADHVTHPTPLFAKIICLSVYDSVETEDLTFGIHFHLYSLNTKCFGQILLQYDTLLSVCIHLFTNAHWTLLRAHSL